MLGTASPKAVSEMLSYAHETQHEKIIRGLAMGIALTMYGKEEEADTLIDQLIQDKDPILRYGGMYTIGLAYAGTANNNSIKKLLHVAVSDVSDDVRRAAVIALGFLLFTIPKQCPRLVGLLAESYNPHVRYGATLAVGISCASTGMKEAIELLEPMTKDPVDFVRQGAAISLAMVLCQVTKAQEPKVDTVRKFFEERIAEKHEEVLARMGSIVASGIIDAGGRNVTISLSTPTGHKNMVAIVGLAVFTQFWYWFPLIHFISLSMTPTAVIGLNKDLKMPVMKYKSNAPPSIFAYPPETKPPTTAAPSKAPAAVLSTTNKRRGRGDKDPLSKSSTLGESMSLDTPDPVATPKKEETAQPSEADKSKEEKEKEKETEKEKGRSKTPTASRKRKVKGDETEEVEDKTSQILLTSKIPKDGADHLKLIITTEFEKLHRRILAPQYLPDSNTIKQLLKTTELILYDEVDALSAKKRTPGSKKKKMKKGTDAQTSDDEVSEISTLKDEKVSETWGPKTLQNEVKNDYDTSLWTNASDNGSAWSNTDKSSDAQEKTSPSSDWSTHSTVEKVNSSSTPLITATVPQTTLSSKSPQLNSVQTASSSSMDINTTTTTPTTFSVLTAAKSDPCLDPQKLYDQLDSLRIPRSKLESIIDRPDFEQLITGFFARVSVGMVEKVVVYKVFQIVGVASAKPYRTLNNKQTTHHLVLQYGNTKQTGLILNVSNSKFLQSEVDSWSNETGITSLDDQQAAQALSKYTF
eukprot:TRINITY_DN3688_c0_g3_i2.p1 TRINITY_DN3688_c0_g3~~TRINITY_DN3688_c0_g3_i2.p1  ORF type:complete len:752 (-),score=193.49 TRINITY_DN3688_c0_g3_i2:84-2339(-)